MLVRVINGVIVLAGQHEHGLLRPCCKAIVVGDSGGMKKFALQFIPCPVVLMRIDLPQPNRARRQVSNLPTGRVRLFVSKYNLKIEWLAQHIVDIPNSLEIPFQFQVKLAVALFADDMRNLLLLALAD